MTSMSILLTVVSFLLSFNSLGESCEEVELGQLGKNHWRDSLSNGLRGELLNQIKKNDDLFDKIAPEVVFPIIPELDFKFKFSRTVKEHLPFPKTGKVTARDFLKLKVSSNLHLEFSAGAGVSFFSTGGSAGLSLTHVTNTFPGEEISTCDQFSKIIDRGNDRGALLFDGVCETRDKSLFLKYFDKTIDFFSKYVIGKVMDKIVSTKKNVKYAQDPLSPLKIHSLLGVPLENKIFFENNSDLALGDIVEHTSFYSFTPFNTSLGLSPIIGPSYSRYRRIFRTLSFKKIAGNKVIVEIEDSSVEGDEIDIYNIDIRFLKIIKVNFGKWGYDSFKLKTLSQRFEIDLEKRKGLGFFKKILYSAYTPTMSLSEKSIIIDSSAYSEAVKVTPVVFTDGNGADYNINLKFFGFFKSEDRSLEKLEKVSFMGEKFLIGEKIFQRELKKNIPWRLGPIDLRDHNRNFECKMKISSSVKNSPKKESAMNIECSYLNEFANNKDAKMIKEFLKGVLSKDFLSKDERTLERMDYIEKDRINMYSNLSFSEKEIVRILNSSEDDTYMALSTLLFGKKSKNIFSKKEHFKWRRGRPTLKVRSGGQVKRAKVNSLAARSCSLFLYKNKITKTIDPDYDAFLGSIGKGKGILPINDYLCYDYYKMAKRIVKHIASLGESLDSTERFNKILNVFTNLKEAAIVQAVLSELAGGADKEGVHFSYIVSSPYLEKIMARSNGVKYDIRTTPIKKKISEEKYPDYFPRINDIRFMYNTCERDVLFAYMNINYKVEDKVTAQFLLGEYSLGRNTIKSEYRVNFDKFFYNEDHQYIATIKLDEELSENMAYSMRVELQNEEKRSLSRQVEVYLKKIITASEDLFEDFFEEEN